MPANIESMFSVRQMPWHREGTILADYPGTWAEARTLAGLATDLLAIPVSPAQRELFITEFIPMPPAGLVTDRVARNVDEARAALRAIFDSKTTEQVAPTAYGLVQAAGEYLDH